MELAIPSRTALSVALRRAAHQLHDSPVVFADPIAVAILGATYAEELRRTPLRMDRPFSIALRAFLVARSRYAEDNLRRAVASGVDQYVLLGAGLDTFAYRNPFAKLRVTLSLVSAQPAGSGLTLDYGQPRDVLPVIERLAHDSLASRVERAGEPFRLFFTPPEIAAELSRFHGLEDLGAAEINARYFSGRTDQLAIRGTAGRLLSAWV